MEYLSTRSSTYFVDSAQAVLNGLAPDGGLYVPRGLPQLDVTACLNEDTMQMAARIIGALLPDIPDMEGLVKKLHPREQEAFQTPLCGWHLQFYRAEASACTHCRSAD